MNTKNLVISGLVGAVITLALTNIPFVSLVNCIVCAGFWLGPLFAVWMYKRMSGTMSTREGLWVGVISGAIAGVIGLLLSFIGAAGAAGMINQINMVLPTQDQISFGGVEGFAGNLLFTGFGVIFDIIVGAIGGWVGSLIFKDRPRATATS
jgi:uncharacterized membrane protein YeaQ/YmgE (transglycosylase-associated protein family)